MLTDNIKSTFKDATQKLTSPAKKNLPTLEADIHHLVQEQSQVDPTFRSTLSYARISARAVRKALLQEKGYRDHELPSRQTIGSILNRLGYRLKKHKK